MFLKNKNIIFKIRRSKVTDYAALSLAFYSSLSTECSFMVFGDFQIEFHAELKNELFVQGHHI